MGVLLTKKKKSENIDVLGHFLVSPMRILTEEQAAKMLKQFNVGKDGLPKINESDPAVQALQAKAGDVLAIERNDQPAKHTSYRVVV